MTTETAQRRLLEALAALHNVEPVADPLLSFIAGIQQAQRIARALDSEPMFEVYGCLIDLAQQVRCDLMEGITR